MFMQFVSLFFVVAFRSSSVRPVTTSSTTTTEAVPDKPGIYPSLNTSGTVCVNDIRRCKADEGERDRNVIFQGCLFIQDS